METCSCFFLTHGLYSDQTSVITCYSGSLATSLVTYTLTSKIWVSEVFSRPHFIKQESSLWTVLTDRLGGSVVVINAAHSTTAFASLTAVSSSHRAIISLVSRVMPIFAPFHLFDALAGTSGGVLRGTGKQKMGAFSNAIGYYVFGFPLGVSLMFAAHHGIIGECLVPW